MKKTLMTAAAGFALAGAMAGTASADVTIELGDFTLNPGQIEEITVGGLFGTLTGWELTFTYGGNTDGSWSADMLFAVGAPSGNGVAAGGFNIADPGGPFSWTNIGGVGANNGDPGTFTHLFENLSGFDVSGTGTWSMFVGDGWTSGTVPETLTNVSFTLFGVNIPAPGALALLGMAGLVSRRRRRA